MALPFFNKKTSPKDEPTTGAIALPEQLPQHVGFIMDGNGRWATKRGMPRKFGHREGAKNFKDLSLYCRDIGLRNASFYVFSTENWKRPQDEVDAIMDLFWDYLCEADQYLERRVRMVFVGDRSRLQDRLQKRMEELEHDSRDFEKMNLVQDAVNAMCETSTTAAEMRSSTQRRKLPSRYRQEHFLRTISPNRRLQTISIQPVCRMLTC